jgi:hypothetical protein
MFTFAGSTETNITTAASAPSLRVRGYEQKPAGDHFSDPGGVGIEPRVSGQFGGND